MNFATVLLTLVISSTFFWQYLTKYISFIFFCKIKLTINPPKKYSALLNIKNGIPIIPTNASNVNQKYQFPIMNHKVSSIPFSKLIALITNKTITFTTICKI